MSPEFKHDCKCCEFLGHFFGHDVYRCSKVELGGLGSIIARDGSKGHEYSSTFLSVFLDQIQSNSRIGLLNGKSLPFQDYLFSEHATPYHKAWLLALTLRGMK